MQIGKIGGLAVLGFLLGFLRKLLLELLQIGGSVREPDYVDRQALRFGGADLDVLSAGEDGAKQGQLHLDTLEVEQRDVLARRRADLDVGDAGAQAGEELRRDGTDLDRPSPLLRELLRLLAGLGGEDSVEHEGKDDEHRDDDRGGDAEDLLPALHRAGT